MSNLAQKIDETNTLLRELATAKPAAPKPTPEPIRPRREWRDPERLRASMFMLAIPGIGDILREHFKEVPAGYFEDHDDKSRTLTCLCSAKATILYGDLHTCDCGRLFFNGVTLKVAPAPTDDDVQVCDLCCGEFRTSQGALCLIDGVDGFACDSCRGES